MRAAYDCFKAGTDPERIIAAAEGDRDGHDRFYAQLVRSECKKQSAQPSQAAVGM